MAGGNFLHRVITYVANELVVNGLANSPSFQRFAVRTSRKIEDISKMAAKTKQEVSEKVKDATSDMHEHKLNCSHPMRNKPASRSGVSEDVNPDQLWPQTKAGKCYLACFEMT
ncbi:hypothetical protein V2J09_010358 [Rumex salicifolius]